MGLKLWRTKTSEAWPLSLSGPFDAGLTPKKHAFFFSLKKIARDQRPFLPSFHLQLLAASMNKSRSCFSHPKKSSQPNTQDYADEEEGGGGVINTQRRKIPPAQQRRSIPLPKSRDARLPARPPACQLARAMAVPPEEHRQRDEQEEDDSDEFTFPTPPPQLELLGHGTRGVDGRHLPCSASASSSPPVWQLLSSPIRRSFSAADCAASPWRDRVLLARQRLNGACSPALSDYAAAAGGFCDDEEEEEERMDSLWEDLNDDDAAPPRNGGDLFKAGSLDVSRRRSVAGGPDAAERARRAAKDQREAAAAAAVLGASRSSRRRPPGLVVMMRALRRMFVAHKGKSRVHRDEQSASAASASASSFLH